MNLEEQIADLAHQVVETRNQVIKSSNMISNLAGEMRELGHKYFEQKRLLTFNSGVAYIIFAVLITTSFYFTYRNRVERIDFEKDALQREYAAAQSKLESMSQALEKRREAETKAAAFYRLSQNGPVQQALKQYATISQLPLSRVEAAVFQDWVSRNRSRLAYASYIAGMHAINEKQWKRATIEFQRSLELLPTPPHEAAIRYHLGFALMNLGNYSEAASELERAISADAEKLVSKEVRFYLGTVYEQMGQRDKASAAYNAYLKQHPNNPIARQIRRRLAAMK